MKKYLIVLLILDDYEGLVLLVSDLISILLRKKVLRVKLGGKKKRREREINCDNVFNVWF